MISRHEVARTGSTHLVLVDQNLGVPLGRKHPAHRPTLGLRQGDKIAVVVVADVVVIQPGHRTAFVGGPKSFTVVLDDHIHSVGIERRDHHDDDIVEPTQDLGILGGGQLIGQQRQGLGGRHLGRVHRQGGHDEDPARVDHAGELVVRDRRIEGKTAVDFTEFVQPLDIPRG